MKLASPEGSSLLKAVRGEPLASLCALLVLLDLVGYAAWLYEPDKAFRYVIMIVIAAVGLPQAVRLLGSHRRWQACLALAFAAWSTVAAAVSSHPWQAFWGIPFFGNSLVMVLALVGAWALGVLCTERGSSYVRWALIAGGGINAVAGLSEVLWGSFLGYRSATYQGRAVGLFSNPIPEAQLLIGVFWLCSCAFVDVLPPSLPGLAGKRWRGGGPGNHGTGLESVQGREWTGRLWVVCAWCVASALVVAALFDTGSREMVALLAVGVVAIAIRSGWWRGVVNLAVVGVGIGVGAVASALGRGLSAASHLAQQGALGLSERFLLWREVFGRLAARPLVGFGPGRFIEAASPHMTLRVARYGLGTQEYADAHDIVVEYALTIGIVGAVLLLAWLSAAIRTAGWRKPLAGFALLVLASQLLESQNPALTPVCLLALGAAVPVGDRLARPAGRAAGLAGRLAGRWTARAVCCACAAAGLAVAACVYLSSWELQQSFGAQDPWAKLAPARDALGLPPPWPTDDIAMAEYYVSARPFDGTAKEVRTELAWLARAIETDPTESTFWVSLGNVEMNWDLPRCARYSYGEALHDFDWSASALDGEGLADEELGDRSAAAASLAKLREVDPLLHAFVTPLRPGSARVPSVSCPRPTMS